MMWKIGLIFVFLHSMSWDCYETSESREPPEPQNVELHGETLEIHFSNVKELEDILKNHKNVRQYFYEQLQKENPPNEENAGESCRNPRAITITTSLTSMPVSETTPSAEVAATVPTSLTSMPVSETTPSGEVATTIATSLSSMSVPETTPSAEVATSVPTTLSSMPVSETTPSAEVGKPIPASLTSMPVSETIPSAEVGTTILTSLSSMLVSETTPSTEVGTTSLSSMPVSDTILSADVGTTIPASQTSMPVSETIPGTEVGSITIPTSQTSMPVSEATTTTEVGKKIHETSRAITTQEETTPGCAVLNKTDTCNITYHGKCFILLNSGAQNVNLLKANETCVKRRYELGNIYDNCHFSYIMNQLETKPTTLWTGMTIVFSNENHQVYFHSNQSAIFPIPWFDQYPKKNDPEHKYLQITVKPNRALTSSVSYKRGITNSDSIAKANGVICQKDL